MTGKLLRTYQRDRRRSQLRRYEARLKNIVEKLEARRLILITPKGNDYLLTISEEGRKIIKQFDLKTIIIPQPQHWDGRWRIIGFDIPERHKLARDVLRDLLKRLTFFPLQKSVWIYPYPCRDEVEIIRYAYNLGSELWFCETDTLDREPELLHHFGLLSEATRLLKRLKRSKKQ